MIDVYNTHQYANFSLEDLGLPAPDAGCADSKKFFLGAVGNCHANEACMTTLTNRIMQNPKLKGTALFDLANRYIAAAGRQNQLEMRIEGLGLLLHLDRVVGLRFPKTKICVSQ